MQAAIDIMQTSCKQLATSCRGVLLHVCFLFLLLSKVRLSRPGGGLTIPPCSGENPCEQIGPGSATQEHHTKMREGRSDKIFSGCISDQFGCGWWGGDRPSDRPDRPTDPPTDRTNDRTIDRPTERPTDRPTDPRDLGGKFWEMP
jgi:hypothetical protein